MLNISLSLLVAVVALNAWSRVVVPDVQNISTVNHLFSVINSANKRNNFNSLLTYEANGFTTTFQLNHRIDQQDILYQRLKFLDGPKRQVLRQQRLSSCDQGKTRWGLWPVSDTDSYTGSPYRLQRVGVDRIADRDADVFDIIPMDQDRYHYSYSIDRETGLVLKITTYYKGVIVERVQVVELTMVDTVINTDIEAQLWRVSPVEPCYNQQFQSPWRAEWLPEGFKHVGNRMTTKGEHVMMFADGIVSVSVFISYHRGQQKLQSIARYGATVLVSLTNKDNETITVVGELPMVVAKRIAKNITQAN